MGETALNPATLAAQIEKNQGEKGLPPVDSWDPPYCGEMDIRIARDGQWYYMNSPIGRKQLVRLFSTILRRDEDAQYYLVTPVEKVRIQVEDAPFVATLMEVEGQGEMQQIRMQTNVGDTVELGPDYPLRVEQKADGEPAPYIRVRANLEALVARTVFYQLVDMAVERVIDGVAYLGVWSRGVFFPLGEVPTES